MHLGSAPLLSSSAHAFVFIVWANDNTGVCGRLCSIVTSGLNSKQRIFSESVPCTKPVLGRSRTVEDMLPVLKRSRIAGNIQVFARLGGIKVLLVVERVRNRAVPERPSIQMKLLRIPISLLSCCDTGSGRYPRRPCGTQRYSHRRYLRTCHVLIPSI